MSVSEPCLCASAVKQSAHELSLFAEHAGQRHRREHMNHCSLVALLPVTLAPCAGGGPPTSPAVGSLYRWQPGSESAVERILDTLRIQLAIPEGSAGETNADDLALVSHLHTFYVLPSLVRLLLFLRQRSDDSQSSPMSLSNGFKLSMLECLIELGERSAAIEAVATGAGVKKAEQSSTISVTCPVTSMLSEDTWDCIKHWSMDKPDRKVTAALVKWIGLHCALLQSREAGLEMVKVVAQSLGSRVSKEVMSAMKALRTVLVTRLNSSSQEECMHFVCGFQESSVVSLDWWFGSESYRCNPDSLKSHTNTGLRQNYLSALCDHPKAKVRRSLYSTVLSLCRDMSTSYDYRTLLLTYVMSGMIENDWQTRCHCLASVESVSEHWMADSDVGDLTIEKHSSEIWIQLGIIDLEESMDLPTELNFEHYVPSLQCLKLMREHFGRIHLALLSEVKSPLIKPKQKYMTLNLLLVFMAYLQWYIGGFSLQISEALRQAQLALGSSSAASSDSSKLRLRNEMDSIIEVCLQTLRSVCQFETNETRSLLDNPSRMSVHV